MLRSTAAIVAPTILGVLLAFSNWRLIRENRRLSDTARYYSALRHPAEGIELPDLKGKDLQGRELIVPSRGMDQQTLLFVFSPTCPHCKRNWPAWIDLAKASAGKRIVFVNVGGALPANFSQLYSFDSAAVMAQTNPETVLQYSLFEFPLTILLSAEGRSEKVAVGELTADSVKAFTTPRP